VRVISDVLDFVTYEFHKLSRDLRMRVIQGRKKEGDRVVEILSPTWNRLTMRDLARMIKVLYENEQLLYPPKRGCEGGERLMRAIRIAVDSPLGVDDPKFIAIMEKRETDC
jgi:hypothetical protein